MTIPAQQELNDKLFKACLENKTPSTIYDLLMEGAQAWAWNEKGETPLHVAAVNTSHPQVIEHLMEFGADASARTCTMPNPKTTEQ